MPNPADARTALPVEQGALLWCIRTWVTGLHHEIAAETRIRTMMGRLGAEEAAPYLEGFMFAIGHGATRRIAIHCVCHTRVEADEGLLLRILGLAQENRPREALLLLRGLVTEPASRAALRSAQGLGAELAFAGRFLPALNDAPAAPAWDGAADPARNRAGATLH